jgi:hypothetical protein
MGTEDIMQGLTPPPATKNGVCSAHSLLVDELKKINEKLDKLTTNDARQEAKEEIIKEWTDRGIGACFVLIPLIIFELIKYFTPL